MSDEERKGIHDPWRPGLEVQEEPQPSRGEVVPLPRYDDRDIGIAADQSCSFHRASVPGRIIVRYTDEVPIAVQRLLHALNHPYALRYLETHGFQIVAHPADAGFALTDGYRSIWRAGDIDEGWRLFVNAVLNIQQANKYVAKALQRQGITIRS